MGNRAVFLDRDRTIIEDPGYLSDASAVKLLPGADLAIRSLRQAGYKVIVVTNQSGIARGLLTEEALERIHAELRRQLAAGGAHVDAIYFCPCHPEGTVERYAMESDLRKPHPGMLLKAAKDFDIDLPASWMVGDGARDIEAGQRAGCLTVRIRAATPPLPDEQDEESAQADFTVRNLLEATKLILQSPQIVRPGGARRSAGARTAAIQPAAAAAPARPDSQMTDRELLLEIVRLLRQIAERQ